MNSHQRRVHRRKCDRLMALMQDHLQSALTKFVSRKLGDEIVVQLQDTIVNVITFELKI